MVPFDKHLVLLLITFAFIGTGFTQQKADIIKQIKVEFQNINKDKSLKKVTLDNEEFLENMPDGGGELSGYYRKGEIKKVSQWVGLSNGNEIKEYYFKNGKLIFVYEKFNSFIFNSTKQELDRIKSETTFVGRYYFNNNKLIDYIT